MRQCVRVMVATIESFRKLQKPLLFVVLSIFLLVVYYAKNKPTLSSLEQQVADNITPQTIVGFQSRQETIQRNCAPHEPRNFSSHGWQQLDSDSHLYSAHLDNRTGNLLIRIVALLRGDADEQLFCRTWPGGPLSVVKKTELWVQSWDFAERGRYLHPYLLSCSTSETARAVSVVSDPCREPSNVFDITSKRQEEKEDFVICVKPLDYPEDITYRLLEWLELQFILGVNNVLAYVHNLHPNTRRLLDHYEGRVTVVEHSPPATEQQVDWKSTWQRRRLETALYNDCFYRHISSHRFVANLDLDEAIVPLAHDSWTELLRGPAVANSASVSARNVYFFDQLGVDWSVPLHLHMLRHVYRSANFTPPGFAQKSFFNTLHAEAVAHHYALRAVLRPGGGVRLMSGLDVGQARLHHYRSRCPSLMERQCAEDFMRYRVKDNAIWRFRKPLELAVALKMQTLGIELTE